ncbi:MAG: metalloregulator ArsR/SmtB family transcription factor [Myxococcota bacterium]
MVAELSVFQLLADPTRLALVEALRDGEVPVGELVARLPIAQSGVSRHLRLLREAGLVEVRADGQRRLYQLRPEPFATLDGWLDRYRAVWESRLDRFGAALERRRPTQEG